MIIMRKSFLLVTVLYLLFIANVQAQSVRLSNDTLYCNLTIDEVGTLKAQTADISDLNIIKTLVLGGYISQPDEDFIHTLGKNYSLNNIDMTELLSTMSYEGLQGCTKLISVKYSKYWTSTGQYLFEDCTNLSEVIFPADDDCSLTTFSSGTFRGCSSLERISIPKGIISMDSQVFYICNNLKEIHCNSGNAPLATEDTFGGQFNSATIVVPTGAIMNYKTSSGWCLFKNFSEDPNNIYEVDKSKISTNVTISNDTLFCNMTESEGGYLRTTVLSITEDIGTIKHAVLEGYLNQNDGSFLNSLCSAYGVTTLDMTNLRSTFSNYLFQGCTNLTELKFSRYWNSTGWYLFKDCSNLVKVEFPDNYVGSGYTVFETGSFRGCTSLQEITIPATVTSIGNQCFYVCDNLNTILLKPVTPPSATEDSFGGQFASAKLIVPKGTSLDYQTAAGWSLFSNIEESNEDVELGQKETSENILFSDGTLYINLPIEEVGRLKATVLTKYGNLNEIQNAVISNYIDDSDANFLNALASTYSLSSIDFSEMKNTIGSFAFQGCIKLNKVIYSRYWTSSGWYLFEDCSSLKEVQFPAEPENNGIQIFSSGTFRGCSVLQDISIPKNVTSISSQCFYLCSSLKNVTFLGSAIKSIDKGAFEGCYSLETITLPSSMTLIGERCFEGCPSIKEINSDAVTPPEVSESSFDDIYNSATLYVPSGSRELYAAAPVWNKFANIQEKSSTSISNLSYKTSNSNMILYTTDGKLVYKGNDNSKQKAELKKGVYILEQNGKTKKVIIK